MRMRTRSELPWRDGDIVLVSLATLVTAMAIGGAWIGASEADAMTTMAVWLQVAVAALVVFSVGVGLWLLRDWRTVTERRVALLGPVSPERPSAGGHGTAEASGSEHHLVRAEGMQRVHRAGCPLVAGKQVVSATCADGSPCGVCHG